MKYVLIKKRVDLGNLRTNQHLTFSVLQGPGSMKRVQAIEAWFGKQTQNSQANPNSPPHKKDMKSISRLKD